MSGGAIRTGVGGMLTLLGGWMRFLLAWASDRKRLFFEPVYSLKLAEWSGRLYGLVTSDRKFCLENLQGGQVNFFFFLGAHGSTRTRSQNVESLRNLKFAAVADRYVVQMLDTALDCYRVTHLHHGGALFCLQELYLQRGKEFQNQLGFTASHCLPWPRCRKDRPN